MSPYFLPSHILSVFFVLYGVVVVVVVPLLRFISFLPLPFPSPFDHGHMFLQTHGTNMN